MYYLVYWLVFIPFLSFAYRKINRLEKRLYETTKARDKADKKLVSNHKSWEKYADAWIKYANDLKEAGIRCEDEANEIIAEKNRIIREKNDKLNESNLAIIELKSKLERTNEIIDRLSNMNTPQPIMEPQIMQNVVV